MAIDEHPDPSIKYAAGVLSALDSEQRLQIVHKLADRDHVVHELVTALGKSQPLISQHLRVLKRGGLVTSTRSGREVIYRLAIPEAADIIELADQVGRKAAHAPDATVPEVTETSDSPRAADSSDRDSREQEERMGTVTELQTDREDDEFSTGGRAAIVGQANEEQIGNPGLRPDVPTPPIPRIT